MLKILFYLCVFTLTLGQFSAIYKSGESSLYAFDIFLALYAFIGLLTLLASKKFLVPKYLILFFVFSFCGLASLATNAQNFTVNQNFIALFYLVRLAIYLMSALVTYNLFQQKQLTINEFTKVIALSGGLISLIGFIQLLVLPDLEILDKSLGWDPHKNRLFSSFFDPNFTGAYLVLCFTLIFNKFAINREVPKFEKFLLLIYLVAIVLTFSRSAWLMLAVVVFLYGVYKFPKMLVVSLLVAFGAYFAVPRIQTRISGITDPADSASFRWVSWKNTLKIVGDNPLIGVGFNTMRYVQKDYGFLSADEVFSHAGAGSDSSMLFVLATTGVIGFLVFILGMLFPIYDLSHKKSIQLLFVCTVIISLLLESQFINSLFYPQIIFLWLSFIVMAEYTTTIKKVS